MENMAEVWKKLINKLIEDRGEVGGLECQLTLANGAQAAGTLVKTEYPELYRFVTFARKEDGRGSQGIQSVDMYVPVNLVVLLTLPTAEKDKPRIVAPGGRIIGG